MIVILSVIAIAMLTADTDDPGDTGKIPDPPGQTPKPSTHISLPATDSQVEEIYSSAYADCTSGRYDEAIEQFQQIVKYPSFHGLKDNAQYWLAECYYAQKDYARALVEFQKVRELFPRANKLFDAELKIAYTYYNLRDLEAAKRKILQLSTEWPDKQYQSRIATLSRKIRSG